MPTTTINGTGLGQLFSDTFTGGSGHYRDMADAYVKRRGMEMDELRSRAAAAKAEAERKRVEQDMRFQQRQIGAAETYGGSLGDLFVERFTPETMPQADTFVGPPQPGYLTPAQDAFFRKQASSYALSIPGANPEQVAKGNMITLGANDMIFNPDPTAKRIGAAAALGKFQGANDILLPGDREAVYNHETLQTVLGNQNKMDIARMENEGSADGGAGFGGNGAGNTDLRIINQGLNAFQNGLAISNAMKNQLSLAYTRNYGPRTEVRLDSDTGQTYRVQIQPPVPAAVKQMMTELGILGAVPVQNNAPGAAGAGAPSSPMGASAPAVEGNDSVTAPVVAPAAGGKVTTLGNNVIVESTGGGKPKSLTDAESRNELFHSTMRPASDALDRYSQSPMGFMQMEILRGEAAGENPSYIDIGIQNMVRAGSSPEAKQFLVHVENFINPTLRKESGAAVPASEYPKYLARFIPLYGDDQKTISLKADYRRYYLTALERGLAQVSAAKGTAEYNEQVAAAFSRADSTLGQLPEFPLPHGSDGDIEGLIDKWAD